MTTKISPVLPGRLGTPDMVLRDDPRIDPRIVQTLAAFEMDGEAAPAPFGTDAPLEARLGFCAEAEPGFEGLFVAMIGDTPAPENVENSTETIKGVDGNDIKLFIHRPANTSEPLPCVLHIHGGGMAILSAGGAVYTLWRQKMAATGLVVVGVEFRNSAGALGPHPFPAGLNDCTSALKWINENKEALGISNVIISGDSGGGNLTIATTLNAKQDGHLDMVDGVYAQCPYISNDYIKKETGFASLTENDTYFLTCHMLGVMGSVYDGADSKNPLAWPLHSSVDDLEGLPPHVISVNQLDPLRDEGLAYYRKLMEAGVQVTSRTVNGTTHAADVALMTTIPDVAEATLMDIKRFADSL